MEPSDFAKALQLPADSQSVARPEKMGKDVIASRLSMAGPTIISRF